MGGGGGGGNLSPIYQKNNKLTGSRKVKKKKFMKVLHGSVYGTLGWGWGGAGGGGGGGLF